MCAGSPYFRNVRDAQMGEQLRIADFGERKMFAPATGDLCPVCVPFNSTVMFRNLDERTRTRLNVGAEAKAVMTSPDVPFGAVRIDIFTFDNGRTANLDQLPVGTLLDIVPASIVLPAETSTAPQPELVRASSGSSRRPQYAGVSAGNHTAA